jgi:hypothetical protein
VLHETCGLLKTLLKAPSGKTVLFGLCQHGLIKIPNFWQKALNSKFYSFALRYFQNMKTDSYASACAYNDTQLISDLSLFELCICQTGSQMA